VHTERTVVSDEVFLKFQYEERDFADAMRLRMVSAFRGRFDLAIGAAVCVAGIALSYAFAPAWMWRAAMWFVGVAVVGIVATALVALRVVPRVMFRKNAALQSPTSLDASEEGITLTVGKRFATIKWRDCRRLEADKNAYIVYHGARGAIVVPRRVFRNDRQDESFRSLVTKFARDDEAQD
jgi:hypothetical protein